jgi:hypothetical protein
MKGKEEICCIQKNISLFIIIMENGIQNGNVHYADDPFIVL